VKQAPVIRTPLLTGVALALLILGTHPQWAFYAGVFAAAWTFPADRSRRAILRWLACGLGAVAVAVLLCAVQLLPTLEASRYSTRTGTVEASGSLSLALPTFLGLVGPSLTNDPPRTWEVRGVFAAVWLAAALAAPKLAGGRARWHLGVLIGLLFFSLGGAALVEWLPGFGLFRVPGRMLLIATFSLAVLAGATTDALIRSKWDAVAWQVVKRNLGLVVAVVALPALLAAVLGWRNSEHSVWLPGVLGWAGTLVAVVLVVVSRLPGPLVWVVALAAELLLPTVLLPGVRPQAAIYPPSETVAYLAQQVKPGEARVLGRDADGLTPLGVGAPLAMVDRIESVRGYNPLDVRHYRAFLGFVTDDPGPLKGNSPFTQQVIPNFEVANPALLDLMNVRYLVAPADEPPPPGSWRAVAIDAGSLPVPPLKPGHPPRLPPYTISENPAALPRAFVVPEAAAMPAGGELDALRSCDFRRTVLLATDDPLPPNGTAPFRTTRITEYRPNRVAVELDGRAGFLALSDVWFPGWTCRIDGAEVPIYRANHAFRAVAVPDGAKEAEFTFAPRSYQVGGWVSAVSLVALLVAFGVAVVRHRGA
jgi:hypothetical protein